MQLPVAASLERTSEVLETIDGLLLSTPGVANWVTLGGFSILDGTNSSNAATIFVISKPWSERTTPETSQPAILSHLQRQLGTIQEAVAFAFPPPAINGLGASGGFQMQLQDRVTK